MNNKKYQIFLHRKLKINIIFVSDQHINMFFTSVNKENEK